MEGKLIKEEIEKLKLKDEAEKIYQKLVEVRAALSVASFERAWTCFNSCAINTRF